MLKQTLPLKRWFIITDTDILHILHVRDVYPFIAYLEMRRGMRFPTMRYVRQAKPQISLRIRAV